MLVTRATIFGSDFGVGALSSATKSKPGIPASLSLRFVNKLALGGMGCDSFGNLVLGSAALVDSILSFSLFGLDCGSNGLESGNCASRLESRCFFRSISRLCCS